MRAELFSRAQGRPLGGIGDGDDRRVVGLRRVGIAAEPAQQVRPDRMEEVVVAGGGGRQTPTPPRDRRPPAPPPPRLARAYRDPGAPPAPRPPNARSGERRGGGKG